MLKECTLPELVKIYDYFILDADGVIWEADKEIGNSANALKYLFDHKKSVFIVTNNSHKSRAEFVEKTRKVLGIDVPFHCWYNSSRTSAIYLKAKHPLTKSIYVVGGNGIFEELAAVGFTNVRGIEDSLKKYEETSFWTHDYHKENAPDCVIAGIDPGFNYFKLTYAANCVRNGATFIATNRDTGIKTGKYLMPGAGSIVAAIEKASSISPVTIGKPNVYSLNSIMLENAIPESDRGKMIMIGDRLETDILFAKNCGIKSCLVLTGVSDREMAVKLGSNAPDYIMSQIGTF